MKIELTTEGAGLSLDKPPFQDEGLTMAILGNKGCGKSNLLAVIAEEFHRNDIPFLFFDPNGDAVSLVELGDDVITVGNPDHDDPIRRADYPLQMAGLHPREIVEMNLKQGYSFIFDLTDNDPDNNPLCAFTSIINEHFRQSGKMRTPCGIIVDEAHTFAPQSGADEIEQASRKALGRIATDGRKRGEILVTATQRPTYLDKRIIFGANVRVFGKLTYFPDFRAIENYLPYKFGQMRELESGEAVIVTNGMYDKVKIKRRGTTDLGKTPAFKRKQEARPSKFDLQLPVKGRVIRAIQLTIKTKELE